MAYPPVAKLTRTADRVTVIRTGRPRPYYSRSGTVRLSNANITIDATSGLPKVTVTFATALRDTNWVFAGLTFWNSADADVDVVQLSATGRVQKSATGFTIQLSGAPPTEDYYMDWSIAEAYNP